MSEKELVSAQNKPVRSRWKWRIVYVVGIYVASCIGTGTYLKFKASKVLLNVKMVSYTIKAKFFPLPVIFIDFTPIVYEKARIASVVRISPYLPGVFSGQYLKFKANFGFSGHNLEGSAFIKSSFDPSIRLDSWRALVYQIKGTKYQSFGKVQFHGYHGSFEAKRAEDGHETASVKFFRGKESICMGKVATQYTPGAISGNKSLKDVLKSHSELQLEPSVLLMAAKLSESLAGKNIFSQWIDANVEHISRLFFPVNLTLSAKGEARFKALNASLNAYLNNIQTRNPNILSSKTQALEFLKTVAQLPFVYKIVCDVSLAKQAQATFQLDVSQEQDAQSSILKVETDIHWGAFLAYFAKQTPESYGNAHKLLSFALGIINKHKTLDRIHTDVFLKYSHGRLEVEDFSVNGLSFGQLLQIFFSNPDMLQYLRGK